MDEIDKIVVEILPVTIINLRDKITNTVLRQRITQHKTKIGLAEVSISGDSISSESLEKLLSQLEANLKIENIYDTKKA